MALHELNFLEFIQSFRRGELLETGDQKLTEDPDLTVVIMPHRI